MATQLTSPGRRGGLEVALADNPALDLYWEGRGQLDVTGSVQLMKGINLFAEGKNLTNTPGVRYFGERFRTYEYEKFGYSIFAGVRVKL